MDHLAPFRIPFVGLKPGQHDFQMEVDSLFFESFPSSETDQITGEAEVTIDKLGSKMDCIVRLMAPPSFLRPLPWMFKSLFHLTSAWWFNSARRQYRRRNLDIGT